jgi:hypothetical protein
MKNYFERGSYLVTVLLELCEWYFTNTIRKIEKTYCFIFL